MRGRESEFEIPQTDVTQARQTRKKQTAPAHCNSRSERTWQQCEDCDKGASSDYPNR